MKFVKTPNGNVRILDSDDNSIYMLHPQHVVCVDPNDLNFVLIGTHFGDKQPIRVHVPSVSHLSGEAFNGSRNDLMNGLDAFFFKLTSGNGGGTITPPIAINLTAIPSFLRNENNNNIDLAGIKLYWNTTFAIEPIQSVEVEWRLTGGDWTSVTKILPTGYDNLVLIDNINAHGIYEFRIKISSTNYTQADFTPIATVNTTPNLHHTPIAENVSATTIFVLDGGGQVVLDTDGNPQIDYVLLSWNTAFAPSEPINTAWVSFSKDGDNEVQYVEVALANDNDLSVQLDAANFEYGETYDIWLRLWSDNLRAFVWSDTVNFGTSIPST